MSGIRDRIRERRAARKTDPDTSKVAAVSYDPRWDSMNSRALRVHYDADLRHPGHGLTNYEAEVLAEPLGGLGKSPWKRISELHTRYNPGSELITNARNFSGQKITRLGEFDTEVEVFVITEAGRAHIREMLGVFV